MVPFRDCKIYLLFLLLVKFHVSGKCEVYFSVQMILQSVLPLAILSSRLWKRQHFIPKRDVRQNDFRTQGGFQQFLYFSN